MYVQQSSCGVYVRHTGEIRLCRYKRHSQQLGPMCCSPNVVSVVLVIKNLVFRFEAVRNKLYHFLLWYAVVPLTDWSLH